MCNNLCHIFVFACGCGVFHIADLPFHGKKDPFADVTFTGGDPFFQAEAFTELARRIKAETNKTIWCYTGFLFERLLERPACLELLEQLDVLVDGPFIMAQRREDLLFRGSENQRLIDVPSSLAKGSVVTWEPEKIHFG